MFNKFKKDFEFLDISQALIFNQNLPHGNLSLMRLDGLVVD